MRKALRIGGDTHNLNDIIGCLQRGEMQAFYNDTSVVLTSIVQAPQRKYIEVFMSAGDIEGVMKLIPQIEVWGKEQGAEFARAMVRPGYERILKGRGWKTKTIVMEYHPEKGN